MVTDRPHGFEIHTLALRVKANKSRTSVRLRQNGSHTKYPVRSVSGKKMIVARVSRRLRREISQCDLPNVIPCMHNTHITSFIS